MVNGTFSMDSSYGRSKTSMIRSIVIISTTALFLLVVAYAPQLAAAEDLLQFTRVGTHPSERELSDIGANSESAQGIAFSGSHWFYANAEKIFKLSQDFRRTDGQFSTIQHDFGDGAKCKHINELDFFENELFVTISTCSDHRSRVMVFNDDLDLLRTATFELFRADDEGSIHPWIAINPVDDEFFYTQAPDRKSLLAFPRHFIDGTIISAIKTVSLSDHPEDVLGSAWWTQGSAFAPNGLLFRVVDDKEHDDSEHTGIWVYQLDSPVTDGTRARRVGFIHIPYDSELCFPNHFCAWFPPECEIECHREEELEGIDLTSISEGATTGDVHIVMLNNDVFEDNVSVFHFLSGDFDSDGVRDTLDNCVWDANASQTDLDSDGVGTVCDENDLAVLLPAITLPIL